MQSISNRITDLNSRLNAAARRAHKSHAEVRLIAVSKTHDAAAIRRAAEAGLSDFGENYVNEALPKIRALQDLPLTWHFIGAIQSNKTADIARHFHWVQTVDRLKIAQRLSNQRPTEAAPLNVLIQINIDDEPQKAGIAASALAEFAAALLPLPRIRVRGLMAIPRPVDDPVQQAATFRRMHELFDAAKPSGAAHWDTLSMGMSGDFEIAIAEGSTMVRIGTAIFGPRQRDATP
jgi:pyridoxal phosphate enzyme (YggS family)